MPINAYADAVMSTDQDPNAASAQLDYWPPVIQKLEAAHGENPLDTQITTSLANAYNNYGVLLAQNKQWRQAEDYMQQAIAISTNPAPIKKNLSNIYFVQANELYAAKTDAAYTRYMHDQVKQLASQAIAQDPTNTNALLLLGDVEYMDQQMTEAQQAWQQAAALLPNNQAVQQRLAQITREATVERNMDRIANPYFNVEIDPSVESNHYLNVDKILNFAHDSVAPDFEYAVQGVVPVVVYSIEEYHDTMVDAPGWSGAVYDGKIRIPVKPDQTNFQQTTSDVVHEYTHSIVGALTNNNCPRWFNEGLAKYEEYRHGVPPRIYLLAIAYNTNNIIPWADLNKAIVSPDGNTALLAYQQAFSFVYFIVNKYGMHKVVEVLKALGTKEDFDTAIQQVYGVPLTTIENDWHSWLNDFITNWANTNNMQMNGETY